MDDIIATEPDCRTAAPGASSSTGTTPAAPCKIAVIEGA